MRKLGPRKLAYIIIAFVAIMVAFASCVTEKQKQRILATCPVKTETTIVRKDSTYEKVVVKYDTSYIKIEGPTKYLPNPCSKLCDENGKLKPFYQEGKKNGLTSKVYSDTSSNVLVTECNADSLMKVIEQREKTITNLRSQVSSTVITNPPIVKYELTGWQHFFVKSGQVLWLILLIFASYKLVKFYLKKRI